MCAFSLKGFHSRSEESEVVCPRALATVVVHKIIRIPVGLTPPGRIPVRGLAAAISGVSIPLSLNKVKRKDNSTFAILAQIHYETNSLFS